MTKILHTVLILSITGFFSGCSSTQKLQEKAPLELGEVYYQTWVAGIQGGGSGINIFIPIESNKNNIKLDSVYFKGRQAKLEFSNKSLFMGRFNSTANLKNDIIMSNEPYAEYGNKAPELPKKNPFNLNDNECVVSYKHINTIKYFKISNILKKEPLLYPSAPPNKQ